MNATLNSIAPNEVLLYLGYRSGEVPEQLEREIADCSSEILSAARPRAVWRAFPLSGRVPEGTSLSLEGADIAEHLADCARVVLMAATLGPDVETLLMRTQIPDMARALILDACASTAIENVCDNLEAQLRTECAARGEYLTDRFSPGYGDLPIAQQRQFCLTLDTARAIGLTVSQSGILVPRKSVTAVLGISSTPRPRRSRGCEHCSLFRTCPYRKDGGHCGN